MAEISQTFLLIATFDIALIAVAIANYAVSASYLGRETRLTRWRLEKRKEKLNQKIKELQAKGTVKIEDLKREIKEAEKERDQLGNRVFLLSWNGAVIVPCISFIISLVLAVLGMNLDDGYIVQLVASSLLLALGFVSLLIVIGTIDSAAKQISIPEFDVYFENHEELKMKPNEKRTIMVCAYNKGEDFAENVESYVFIPPEFKVVSHIGKVVKQMSEMDYPKYKAVIVNIPWIYSEVIECIGYITLTAPKGKRIYKIPIEICERKIGVSKHNLTIEVTD
jgi:hypothetical protein